MQERMSRVLGILRDPSAIERALSENRDAMKRHYASGVTGPAELRDFFQDADLLLAERFFLEASGLVLSRIGGGRGSYLAGTIERFLVLDEAGRARAVRSRGPTSRRPQRRDRRPAVQVVWTLSSTSS